MTPMLLYISIYEHCQHFVPSCPNQMLSDISQFAAVRDRGQVGILGAVVIWRLASFYCTVTHFREKPVGFTDG